MSDLAAAAAAMGLPEALVERSAEARAAETGASIDEILAQWAGGAPAPVATPELEPEPELQPDLAEEPGGAGEQAAPEVVIEIPGEPAETGAAPPEPAVAGPYNPPVLVGARDNPMAVVWAALGLFLIILMVGLVGPSLSEDIPGARSSEIDYSPAAENGQHLYATLGCSSCHTQMVRPIVADVGLGGVTLNDSNQVLGFRRFGPDLSDVGTRITGGQIEAIVGGLGDHPPHRLSPDDMSDLVAYLAESRTSADEGEQS